MANVFNIGSDNGTNGHVIDLDAYSNAGLRILIYSVENALRSRRIDDVRKSFKDELNPHPKIQYTMDLLLRELPIGRAIFIDEYLDLLEAYLLK